MTDDSSRRDALRSLSAAAGLVLPTGRLSPKLPRGAPDDRAVLRALLTTERDTLKTYDVVLAAIDAVSSTDPLFLFQGVLKATALHFRDHHREHATLVVRYLTQQGGTDDVGEGQAHIPAGFVPSLQNVIDLATNAEKDAALAHGEAQKTLTEGGNAGLASAISATESQHFVLLDLVARGFVLPPAATAHQPADALAASTARLVPRAFVVTQGDSPGLEDERDLPFHDVSR
ncbi:ferritin-like domain-containing protein [Myxococcus sp. K15C18031901]|uniref:ferritin-like domain-containing protein n=1 Tax=Myxococcus dinghuensis TaxID=2906761 RepID=UPI0020A721D2|nr:ferritin-like domain-containing protein [Myxococcus dinghuensis]MCP3099152.1 ferritin-like domain-containing protein [Myxococcus dinghuensis]